MFQRLLLNKRRRKCAKLEKTILVPLMKETEDRVWTRSVIQSAVGEEGVVEEGAAAVVDVVVAALMMTVVRIGLAMLGGVAGAVGQVDHLAGLVFFPIKKTHAYINVIFFFAASPSSFTRSPPQVSLSYSS